MAFRTLHNYYIVFPELIDESGGTTTDTIAIPEGGSLLQVIVTEIEALTNADTVLTFSTVTAAGSVVAVTGGVVTVDQGDSTIDQTITTDIADPGDDTEIIPAGGALRVVASGTATAGILRIGVITRRK